MSFDYQKAYCTIAVPAYLDLPHLHQKVKNLIIFTSNLTQGRDLKIVISLAARQILESIETEDLAKMSRAVYYVGHWAPGLLPKIIKGTTWKVSNCCDQILRERLDLPVRLEVHDGILRATFSNRNCWMWEEFGLATVENVQRFLDAKITYRAATYIDEVKKLAGAINEVWSYSNKETNDIYEEFLGLRKKANEVRIRKNFKSKIASLEKGIAASQKKIEFLLKINELGVSTDNVIYYKHTDTFCFGWRDKLSDEEYSDISGRLFGLKEEYNIEYERVVQCLH